MGCKKIAVKGGCTACWLPLQRITALLWFLVFTLCRRSLGVRMRTRRRRLCTSLGFFIDEKRVRSTLFRAYSYHGQLSPEKAINVAAEKCTRGYRYGAQTDHCREVSNTCEELYLSCLTKNGDHQRARRTSYCRPHLCPMQCYRK